uniref:Uncharacterized protein n=1 Tax=viral metagenome TaxID=1070528 RepID=A0A6C0F5F6_9ZZZZ
MGDNPRMELLKQLKIISEDYLSFFLSMKNACDDVNSDYDDIQVSEHKTVFNLKEELQPEEKEENEKNKVDNDITNELSMFRLYFNEMNFNIQMNSAKHINNAIISRLKELCKHEIVEDDIDIDVDRTMKIKYCRLCECTFD